jgi:hypothetical protein
LITYCGFSADIHKPTWIDVPLSAELLCISAAAYLRIYVYTWRAKCDVVNNGADINLSKSINAQM